MPRLSKIGAAALAAFGWTGLASVSASYLVVAGGGGGGGILTNGSGGGGGAGGLLSGTTSLKPTLSYTVTVGAGGTASVSGSNSIFNAITSTGGGGGAESGGNNAYTGGSGGGGAGTNTSPNNAGAAGTSGQGNTGGTGGLLFGTTRGGGGGGGASAVGANQNSGTGAAGAGGAGTEWPTSSGVFYAGGGGGGGTTGGAGGTGGGANGASSGTSPAPSGTANKGGGGGGGDQTSANRYGGSGGSGVVIISYPAPQQFGGGVVTTSGSNVIHTFNTSGTLSPLSSVTASYLVVAGGGSGGDGYGGGGGAGGLLSGTGLTIDTNSVYVVTVGAGGTASTGGNNRGNQGTNSTFSAVATAAVGGGGGAGFVLGQTAQSGGSGGGGMYSALGGYGNPTGGSATSGQGYAGGTPSGTGGYFGGGGGGAGAVGATGSGTSSGTSTGGAGGVGIANPITGSTAGQLVSSTYYLAGGGGGGAYNAGASAGAGGNGGGGAGSKTTGVLGTAGTANTGGGGGGSCDGVASSAIGGSGVVIISYAGSTQQMAGGTVTITGGNVIHTFTSSGYLTPIKYVNNSLRFRSSASAYLNRTPATASNRQTWTWSAWIKRGTLSSGYPVLFQGGTTSSDTGSTAIAFGADDKLYVQGYSTNWIVTNAVYRDPSAWYHIVLAMDSTQATGSNRFKLYVNGSEVSYGTYNNLTQNTNYGINQAASHVLAQSIASFGGNYFDGYMTEVNFVDGQQLTPNSFGTINSYGVWQPITYGGSYGTNGFYLPFNRGNDSYAGSFTNSASQYLTATLPATLTGAFTIEAYCYRSTTTTNSIFTLGDSNTSTGIEYYIGTSGTVNNVYSNGAQITTSSNVPVVGGWSHVAVTRDSSNVVRLFINGQQTGGTWTTTAAFSSTLRIGTEYYASAASAYWNGNISNFRIVNGTALYTTSSFAPPTSALTAVSGTSILTLQSSTIIDNSGNSLSITNTNGVNMNQNYPFSFGIFNDQGPSGNNWTGNNITLSTNPVTTSTFTAVTSTTWVAPAGVTSVNYLVVAGGGGGDGGGGGGGGFRYGSLGVTPGTSYTVTVGGGGPLGGNGSNSVFSTITSAGGGGGGPYYANASNGGSGGGSAAGYTRGLGNTPSVSPSQGNNGGTGGSTSGGGGGGAGATGSDGSGGSGGAGGNGAVWSVNGVTYAGGGGGGGTSSGGAGGSGGGGAGSSYTSTAGTPNTGGGGGGSYYVGPPGGGSGIVILSYTQASTSTYDSMTDVPTLTSATAANFCTLNPLNGSGSITNGNLTHAGSGANWYSASSTIAFDASANYYAEVTIISNNSVSNGIQLGVIGSAQALSGNTSTLGTYATGYSWQSYASGSANKFNNGTGSNYNSLATYTTGDVIGVQLSAGTLNFYKNGVSQGSAYTGLSGSFCFGGSPYNGDTVAWNFGQQPFVYTPPTGALRLNTYNL